MSSWVAPPLAAEYLNVSEDEIRQNIREGKLPVCWVGEFLFVDINPDAQTARADAGIRMSQKDAVEVDRLWSLPRQEAASRRKSRKAA